MINVKPLRSTGMGTDRLESLADGIFAFAMTLLVMSINMPTVGQISNVAAFISAQAGNFWNVIVIFFLLSLFWLNHSQQFHHIKKTTGVSILLNLFILLLVIFMPFSTSLMNDYPTNTIAEVFFNLNIFILSALLALNWWYSYWAGLLDPEGDKEHIAKVNHKILLPPALALIAIVVAFFQPGWSSLTYVTVPFFLFWPQRKA